MSGILLQFNVNFKNYEEQSLPYGPLMFRWLPDNQNDSLDFITGNSDFILKGWFERRGIMKDYWIEYDPHKREIDESVIEKQGVLDAGILFCQLEVKNMVKEEYDAITNFKKDDKNYIKFTKKILPIMVEPINKLIRIFNQKYGQYWMKEISPHDSRSASLGIYCHQFNMKWSNDKGKTWNKFIPTPLVIHGIFPAESAISCAENYIKKEDWINILDDLKRDFPPVLPLQLLVRSWAYFNQDRIELSVIEGVTSLELTINYVIKEKLHRLNKTINDIDKIKHSEFPEKIILICSFYESISSAELGGCLKIYNIRNELVHEGKSVQKENVQHAIRNLLNIISKLLLHKSFKFPYAASGNIMQSDDKWKALENVKT